MELSLGIPSQRREGLPRVWLTLFVPGAAGQEGCRHAQEVPDRVQA